MKMQNHSEGFETVPLATDPKTNKISYGYYQVDDTQMAIVPYGFAVDPKDPRKILPITKVAIAELKPSYNAKDPEYNAKVPAYGQQMPDTFYLTCLSNTPHEKSVSYGSCVDASLAVLPPNMSPNLVKIEFSGTPAKLLYYYEPGYISQTQYYETEFTPKNIPPSLPDGLYFVNASKKIVSFLPPDYVVDETKGYGKIKGPNLLLSTSKFNYDTSNYRKVLDNYDTKFHDELDDVVKNSKLYDLQFNETVVKDQNGNMVSIPKTKSQDSVTFYKPGEFPFGSSKYIPNYEDSIYLSSVGYRTRFSNDNTNSNCDEMCQAYNDFKTKMDKHCPNSKTVPTTTLAAITPTSSVTPNLSATPATPATTASVAKTPTSSVTPKISAISATPTTSASVAKTPTSSVPPNLSRMSRTRVKTPNV